jgi:hypothetical protein
MIGLKVFLVAILLLGIWRTLHERAAGSDPGAKHIRILDVH